MGTGTLPDGELSGWSSGTDSCRQSCAALFGPQHKVHHVSRIDSSMTGRYSGRPNVLIILAESISTKVPVASMKVSPTDEPEQVMVMGYITGPHQIQVVAFRGLGARARRRVVAARPG